ncbi:uncharacterized protein LOC141702535 [Apium graveolens]|uniref:uncharacterized protein LOC141702535 n=1 Tax=Apium graveolens TaxID=4045 RepID=UPI003D798F95
MAIEHRKSKSPLDWWDAYGGRAIELQAFARRIVGLCASSSGCERNWSTFEFIHTKKRNRLEHQCLNDLVYVQYNRKIESRFKKRRELGRKFYPLVFEDLEWANEWVGIEDRFWEAVDIASGASKSHEGRNFPRRARGGSTLTYTRRNTSSTQDRIDEEDEDEDNISFDDEEVEDDYGVPPEENTQGGDGDDSEMDDYDA